MDIRQNATVLWTMPQEEHIENSQNIHIILTRNLEIYKIQF